MIVETLNAAWCREVVRAVRRPLEGVPAMGWRDAAGGAWNG